LPIVNSYGEHQSSEQLSGRSLHQAFIQPAMFVFPIARSYVDWFPGIETFERQGFE
jgi:hypothetical protein